MEREYERQLKVASQEYYFLSCTNAVMSNYPVLNDFNFE